VRHPQLDEVDAIACGRWFDSDHLYDRAGVSDLPAFGHLEGRVEEMYRFGWSDQRPQHSPPLGRCAIEEGSVRVDVRPVAPSILGALALQAHRVPDRVIEEFHHCSDCRTH